METKTITIEAEYYRELVRLGILGSSDVRSHNVDYEKIIHICQERIRQINMDKKFDEMPDNVEKILEGM